MEIRGSIAVVTGASSGIGWSTAGALAGEGAVVVASARRQGRLDELVEAIRSEGGRALAFPCDVSDRRQVQALADRVKEEFGRCDALVNNAGVPPVGQFADTDIEEEERIVRINHLGVLYVTKAFLPMMLAAGRGHVVNVASLAGRFATPGSAVYSSTKHAVVAFSEALHHEVERRGLRVTTVNPGFVQTEGFPHRGIERVGLLQPGEVARLIVRVLREDIAPEISIPRWLSSLQIFRLVAPPVYRSAMRMVFRARTRSVRRSR